MPHIYILSASYAESVQTSQSDPVYLDSLRNLTQRARLDVRAGFFSLCVRLPTAIQGQSPWDCDSRDALTGRYGPSVDPLDLITYMDVFANKVVFYGLILGSIAMQTVTFIILATFPGWRTELNDDGEEFEVKPFPSRVLSQVALFAATCATFFGLVSMLWMHVAAVAFVESLDQLARGLVNTSVGASVMGLGWAAVFVLAFTLLGQFLQLVSLGLLDRLVDDEADD